MSKRKSTQLRGSVTQNTTNSRRKEKTNPMLGVALRGSILLLSLGLLFGLGRWLWVIQWPQKQMEHLGNAILHLTQKADFVVKDVVVEGRLQTDKNDLSSALGVGIGAPILSFDPDAALVRVQKLPWVASAVIMRRLPDTLYVRLAERVPIARWQHENQTVVIDRDGKVLPNARLENFAPLPLVVGSDAPKETLTLLTMLRNFPMVAHALQSAVRVSERRWNLNLSPKLLVKLPEKNVDNALQRLSQLIREQKILERDMLVIDLRLPDRLILEQNNAHTASDSGSDSKP